MEQALSKMATHISDPFYKSTKYPKSCNLSTSLSLKTENNALSQIIASDYDYNYIVWSDNKSLLRIM